MTRLSETIRQVLADQRVTDAEVTQQIEPVADADGVPDPTVLRPLYDALASDRVTFEADAAARVGRLLSMAGYLLKPPDARISATRLPQAASLDQPPLSAADRVFEHLAAVTGHVREQIPVAVGDTAIDFGHPLLAGSSWVTNGWDMVHNSGQIGNPREWHGNASTKLTVQGTDRIRAIGVTIMDAPDYEPLFRGIDYAVKTGARIITMSTSMERPENAARLREALARYPDVLFVIAAGNESRHYDAATAHAHGADLQAPNLLVVAAASADGGVWRGPHGGSNTGAPWVSIAARGERVRVPFSLNDARAGKLEGLADGTSLATPQVTNVAAKCWLLSPQLTTNGIVQIIEATADVRPAWIGKARANGTLNAQRAMTVAAVIDLVAGSVPLETALDRVRVSPAERGRVRAVVRTLMA